MKYIYRLHLVVKGTVEVVSYWLIDMALANQP